ncbi:MAG: helix-turn-helix transcriptional regulator [Myxococcota bacterium]
MRRTERLFAMAEYLRGRRTGVTASLLAERFGVTIRTVYRDLDSLRDASLPLHAERGRGGGYALDKAYSLPPVNFTAREAAVLVAAGTLLIRLRILPFFDTLSAALDKVRAALPTEGQRELARLSESLMFTGVPAHTPKPEVRACIERAWIEQQPVRITYLHDNIESERIIRIRSVVMDRAETLLNVHDLEKNADRQFKMHRIIKAVICLDPMVRC